MPIWYRALWSQCRRQSTIPNTKCPQHGGKELSEGQCASKTTIFVLSRMVRRLVNNIHVWRSRPTFITKQPDMQKVYLQPLYCFINERNCPDLQPVESLKWYDVTSKQESLFGLLASSRKDDCDRPRCRYKSSAVSSMKSLDINGSCRLSWDDHIH